jgi:hypothetical protein
MPTMSRSSILHSGVASPCINEDGHNTIENVTEPETDSDREQSIGPENQLGLPEYVGWVPYCSNASSREASTTKEIGIDQFDEWR